MADGPYLAIAYPIAGLPHVGGGPMPGGPGITDPGYGQGHPVPPHIGGGPVYRPPHVGGGPAVPPGHPDQGLPPGVGHPDQGLPPGGVAMPPIYYPPTIWPPDVTVKQGDFLVLVWVPNVGLAWVVVDKDLMPSHDLPAPPAHVGGGPAPTPAPKA
jgi:hypothetical protein